MQKRLKTDDGGESDKSATSDVKVEVFKEDFSKLMAWDAV